MKKWVQVVLSLILLALLLQGLVYFRGTPLLHFLALESAVPLPSPVPVNRGQTAVTEDPLVTGVVRGASLVTGVVRGSRPAHTQGKGPVSAVLRSVSSSNATTANSSSDPHRHHPYPFILNAPAACRAHTELVIVVITAPNNSDDRQAVRDSWGSYARDPHHNTSLVFLLGATPNHTLQTRLEKESLEYGDIVQEDFLDSYRNLSLKSVALLKWVTLHCNTSRFVMKADDDMYVNVPNLISSMRKEAKSRPTFIMGHVFVGAKPILNKNSKWYTPIEQFNEKVYPRYVSGTAYSMTTSAAGKLYRASAEVPLFWLEDIYVTGLCARKAGIPVLHHGGFNYLRRDDTCVIRKGITSHKITASEKIQFYASVNDPTFKCK